MSIERKHVAEQIESLIRQKKLGETQLLHLMWIFSHEDNIKITRNENRRLLRLEKYNDDTLKKVIDFLGEVEKYPTVKISPQSGAASSVSTSKVVPQSDNLEVLRSQEMKRQKVARLQNLATPRDRDRLPRTLPEEIRVEHAREFSDADIVKTWFIRQTKFSKAAKKINPTLVAPLGKGSAMPMSVRVVPKKKKRKPRKKSDKKRKEEENIENEEEEIEEEIEIEEIDEAIPVLEKLGNEPDPAVNEDEEQLQGGDEASEASEIDEAPVGFEMEKEDGEEEEEIDDDDEIVSGEDEDGEEEEDDRKKQSDLEIESSSE